MRDDAPQVERQECDWQGSENTCHDRVTAPPTRSRVQSAILQLWPGRHGCPVRRKWVLGLNHTNVAARPRRSDELFRGEILAYYAHGPPSVPKYRPLGTYRLLNLGCLGAALCRARPFLAARRYERRRVRKPARLSEMRNSDRLRPAPRAMPWADGALPVPTSALRVDADPELSKVPRLPAI